MCIKYEKEKGGRWYIDVKQEPALYRSRVGCDGQVPPLDGDPWRRYQIKVGDEPTISNGFKGAILSPMAFVQPDAAPAANKRKAPVGGGAPSQAATKKPNPGK